MMHVKKNNVRKTMCSQVSGTRRIAAWKYKNWPLLTPWDKAWDMDGRNLVCRLYGCGVCEYNPGYLLGSEL